MKRSYFLGLDIGTDSVGYAVTDEKFDLLKFHGEPAWGVHLFEAGNTRAERRTFRSARRRLDRRQQRVQLIRELFAAEIGKIDPRFYIRQDESALYGDDKTERFSLFNDQNYTDREYHRSYPTIHHLIVDLMNSDEPRDVRLVYLACAWLAAHRGHFFNEIDRNNVEAISDFGSVYEQMMNYFLDQGYSVPWAGCDPDAFGDVIRKKDSLTRKYRSLTQVCFANGKPPKEADEGFPLNCAVLLKALCGSTFKAADLFNEPAYAELQSFSLGSDDETLAMIMGEIGDNAELIEKMKAVYDWGLLNDILRSEKTISEAKVRVYEQHEADLKTLKYFIRSYAPAKYKEVFRASNASGYTAYTYHGNTDGIKRKMNQSDFCKYLKGIIKGIVPEEKDTEAFEEMKQRIELEVFMPKQKTTDNRVVPYQLYWHELDRILKKAERYLPFLSEADADGITVSDKIRSVFTFRIPYFVGPLNPASEFSWAVRKPGRIYPWNFDRMVDLDASEDAFIGNMVGKCTYLPMENALPKDSMLYHRFTVLNEINNLKINDTPISVEAKQSVYTHVFMENRKVTVKKIRDHLIANGFMGKNDTLSGVDTAIKSNLKPQLDFKKLISDGTLTEEQAERIIERRTYTEDAGRYRRWLEKNFSCLSAEDIRYISRLKYSDFGRISRRFLTGIEAVIDPRDGELYTIIGAMWHTNCNLMELLAERYTFAEQAQTERDAWYCTRSMSIDDRLDELYVSNSVRRPIMRTLAIVEEVAKAFGAPEKIFIEMARGGTEDQRGKRTQSRKEQLLELYAKCDEEDVRLLRRELEAMGDAADSRLQSERLFLYYTQLGRCMYTGEPIDITNLTAFNVDHIYPRALVKDDSVLNNKVLVRSDENGRKSDSYPVEGSIREKMHSFWKKLLDTGLIGEEKYKRLTRSTPFSDDEKWGFINRQLTETTQSTKAVAALMNELYPDTEIVYVKARLASEFRQEFDRIKSRLYNDLHHAKDAYLNIVVGQVYNMRFTRRWFSVKDAYSIKTQTLFTHPVICGEKTVWDGTPMLEKVKKNLTKNNIHYTKYAFCRQGGYFDQMPVKAAEGLVPRKKGMDTAVYGGYNKPSIAFFMPVAYKVGKKQDIMIMSVDRLHEKDALGDNAEVFARERVGKILGKPVDSVSFPIGKRVIKINTILSLDGFDVSISGVGSGGSVLLVSPTMAFADSVATELYIKRIENYASKASDNPRYQYDPRYDYITKEENAILYKKYTEKLKDSIYTKRPNNPYDVLNKGEETFQNLSILEQAKAILAIHEVFGRQSGGCDLTLIGGAGHTGKTTINSSISNWKKNYKDVRIIDRSASGLWEKQSENLLELL